MIVIVFLVSPPEPGSMNVKRLDNVTRVLAANGELQISQQKEQWCWPLTEIAYWQVIPR